MNPHDAYPDISDVLARKAQGRKEIAARSFGRKIAMVEAMRQRLEPFKRAREAKLAEKASRARLPAGKK